MKFPITLLNLKKLDMTNTKNWWDEINDNLPTFEEKMKVSDYSIRRANLNVENSKDVVMVNLETNERKYFRSAKFASEELGIKSSYINNSANGGNLNPINGMIFVYANLVNHFMVDKRIKEVADFLERKELEDVIIAYNVKTKELTEYKNLDDVKKKLKHNSGTFGEVLNGLTASSKGHIFIYKSQFTDEIIAERVKIYEEACLRKKGGKRNFNKRIIKVVQGGVSLLFQNAGVASKLTGDGIATIHNRAKNAMTEGRNTRVYSYLYEEDTKSLERLNLTIAEVPYEKKTRTRKKLGKNKKVVMVDKDDNFLAEFKSRSVASKETGTCINTMGLIIRGVRDRLADGRKFFNSEDYYN